MKAMWPRKAAPLCHSNYEIGSVCRGYEAVIFFPCYEIFVPEGDKIPSLAGSQGMD